MHYGVITENGYVRSCYTASNAFADEISADEYNDIMTAIMAQPTAPDGYEYQLRADTLEWELVELPPAPPPGEEIVTPYDIADAIGEIL